MIRGGMEFVWAAYGITWVGLVGYGLSIFRRLKDARARNPQGRKGGGQS